MTFNSYTFVKNHNSLHYGMKKRPAANKLPDGFPNIFNYNKIFSLQE